MLSVTAFLVQIQNIFINSHSQLWTAHLIHPNYMVLYKSHTIIIIK